MVIVWGYGAINQEQFQLLNAGQQVWEFAIIAAPTELVDTITFTSEVTKTGSFSTEATKTGSFSSESTS